MSDTADTADSGITREMLRKGAVAVAVWGSTERDAIKVAQIVLEAALAGRTVVDLPEPTSLADESRGRPPTWDTGGDFTVTAKGGSFGARVNIRGGPYLTASAAEARGAALLAAAREARRLASGFSALGEPT